jgi:hypothetical protein
MRNQLPGRLDAALKHAERVTRDLEEALKSGIFVELLLDFVQQEKSKLGHHLVYPPNLFP